MGYTKDPRILNLLSKWEEGSLPHKYSVRGGLVYYKQMIYVVDFGDARQKLLQLLHYSPIARHSGYDKTPHRVKRKFYWPGWRSDIKKLIRECEVCQEVKTIQSKPSGLL